MIVMRVHDLIADWPEESREAASLVVLRPGVPRRPSQAADAIHGEAPLPTGGDAADPDRRVLSDGQIKAAQAESSERR
jgi:hypothetical protein